MAGATYSVSINDAAIKTRLNELLASVTDLTPVFASIGEMLLISHDERFSKQVSPDGSAWAPLSEEYKKRKKKNADTILTLNSILRGSLTYHASSSNLLFGTPMEYGAIHQFGGSTTMRPQNAAIPQREWLGVSDDDKSEILIMLHDHLMQTSVHQN